MKKIIFILSLYILPFLGLAQRNCTRIKPDDVNDLNLLMSSYIPDDNTPIKTIKMNFNIWRLDDGTGNYWINTQEYRDTLQMIVDYLNYIYSNNDIFSDPVQGADFIPDTKVRFEIDTVYYINNSNLAYWTNVDGVNNYMLSLYPDRSNNFNYHFNLAEFPGASGQSSGYDSDESRPAILTYYQRTGISQNLWGFALHMAHEFGHNFGLQHPYNSEVLEIQHPEFLWDLFGLQTQSWCNAPSTHVCYHDADWTCEPFDSSNTCTNNIMGGSYKARHFTALQCGRIHRALTVSCLRNYAYGYSTTPLFISTNTTWDVKMKFYQDIVIESGATLTITCSLEMVSNAKIVVLPGGKLIIDGGILTNACTGELWQGIFVEGDPNDLTQFENFQGVVELKNGATIQNAVCAINVGRKLLGSAPMMCDLGGGIVRAQNAFFINNLQAIEFGAYDRDLVVGNTHQRNNASEISLCTFTINNNALFDLNEFEEHVKLIEVRGVRFSGCTFESEDFKGSAIRSLSSGFRLADYNWGFLYGYGIRSSVNYFNTAIYIQDGGTKSNVIYNTDFNNNNTSILGEGLSELYIEGNSFNIPYSPYYGPTLGVSLIKCSNFRITNNYFTGHNECDYGLIITHSDENNNIVRNNEFSGLNKACVAYGKNSDGQDGVKGLQYHCNLFDNNTNDIYVADFDSEIGSIRFVQGDNEEACGNIFGEDRISLVSESYNFQYFYNNNLPRHNPFNISSNIRTLPKNTDLCSQIGVINPNIVSAEIPINWYYDLSCEYDLVSLSLNNAKSVYHDNGYDMISIDWEFYFNTVEIPWELEEQVNLYYEIIDLQSQVSEICKLAMYYIHSDSVFDFNVYHDWLTRTHTPKADYLLAESYYEAENYTECFNVLNDIPSNYQFYDEIEYQNYSVFYSIKEYLRTNNIGWESLTGSPEKAILDAIALSGINGGAIKARAIEVAYFGVIIDPFLDPIRLMDLCIYIANTNMEENDSLKKNGLSITEEKSEKNNLSIFPNPAFDKLTVNYENLKIKEISIYDIVGKEVGRYTIDNTKTVLNITHLRPSIYFIQIETENGTVTKRFVKE